MCLSKLYSGFLCLLRLAYQRVEPPYPGLKRANLLLIRSRSYLLHSNKLFDKCKHLINWHLAGLCLLDTEPQRIILSADYPGYILLYTLLHIVPFTLKLSRLILKPLLQNIIP